MKKLIACSLIFLSACTWVELDAPDTFDHQKALQNAQISQVLNGVYYQLQDVEVQNRIFSELQERQIRLTTGSAAEQEIFNKSVKTDNILVENLWQKTYKAIAQAQLLIKNSPADSLLKKKIEGESLFLKAYLQVILLDFFADDQRNLAPPYIKDEQIYPKNDSLRNYFEFLEKDLQKALILLPKNNTNKNDADYWAAQMLLAKIYMAQKKYEAAEIALREIMNSGLFRLSPNVQMPFESPNQEVIWQLNNSQNDFSVKNMLSFLQRATTQFNFELRDTRNIFLENNKIIKYQKAQQLPIFRYSEVVLLTAFVANQNGKAATEVRNLLNSVRLRASLAANNAASSPERLNELIVEEYKKEFLGEGKNAHFFGNAYILPIPAKEISLNKNLSQNTGY